MSGFGRRPDDEQEAVQAVSQKPVSGQTRPRFWRPGICLLLVLLGIMTFARILWEVSQSGRPPSANSDGMLIFAFFPPALILLFLCYIAPVLLVLLLGARTIWWLVGGGFRGVAAALAGMAVLFSVPPLVASQRLDGRVKELVAADHDDGTRPAAGGVIVVRRDTSSFERGRDGRVIACDGLCQRLLLNGIARQVLVVAQDVTHPVDPAAAAVAFRLEKRESCPEADRSLSHHDMIGDEPEQQGGLRKADKALERRMRLEDIKGNCLIAETALLRRADAILSFGTAHVGNGKWRGSALFKDTTFADSITMHEKSGDGFKETFRRTFVTVKKPAPLFMAKFRPGFINSDYSFYVLYIETINFKPREKWQVQYSDRPDVLRVHRTEFLTGRLGYDLILSPDKTQADVREFLQAAIKRPVLDAATMEFASDFLDALRDSKSEEDLAIARQWLLDERFPIHESARLVVKAATEPGVADTVGAALFSRLRILAGSVKGVPTGAQNRELETLFSAIEELPCETIVKHRDAVEVLAEILQSDGAERLRQLFEDRRWRAQRCHL